jgi:LuxR family maltose regulon positive regulatory protein
MATPLLTTKLNIPPLRRSLVTRPRLLECLNRGLRRSLILVSAPAGFGKTTLLVEWIQNLEKQALASGDPPAKVAWLSLDASEDDPARFAAYLTAAIQLAVAGSDQVGTDSPEVARPMTLEPHMVGLINQVAQQPHTFLLVLDDYHLITSQVVHNALAFLVEHLPENLHLAIATRGDPPLPLARLRARGQLAEVRQADLRFTAGEVAAFLNDVADLSLSLEDVAALEARTEGWIAGLQMASLAIRGRETPVHQTRSSFVQAFSGSHRFILDYLMEEVLNQQPPALQEFLLRTSILDRLSGPLCDALLVPTRDPQVEVQPPSQQVLEHLESATLFIVPLDDERRWYRYHRLFSDLLRKRLHQASGELEPDLHRRASEWFEAQGLATESIEHALSAADFNRAAALIEASVEATFMRSEITTFLRWVERLPEGLVRMQPTLCFFHAWALLMSGRSLDTVEQRLQDLACAQDESAEDKLMPGRVTALRAYSMLFRADVERAGELARRALERLPEGDHFLRGIATWVVSLTRLTDDGPQGRSTEASRQELREVARIGQELGNPLLAATALCQQARLQARDGHLHRARETLERALHMATDPDGRRLPIASEALIWLGELWREWNDLESAARFLTEGIELAQQWSEMAAFDAYGPLARVRRAQGDMEGARQAIETARQCALRTEATEVDDQLAELQLGRYLVEVGDVHGATRWAERQGLIPGRDDTPAPDPDRDSPFRDRLRKYEDMVLARLYLLQNRPAEALELLESLLALARHLGRTDLTINIQILRSLAFEASDEVERAVTALEEALALAEPGGHVRTFVDEGHTMAKLLRQVPSHHTSPAYVANLLAEFDLPETKAPLDGPHPCQPQPLIEPLSEREIEVLRLLATGMTNPEIARELYIATSTVRSHCKSIYGKLNVHKRWDAVLQAQELGLL